ncbi:MAG TPA: serine/threonine-protein kinase [Phycisphaerae bacterium]|nr:serine/threonine-protein kinase [Phycisphaerae bacterium]
MTTSAPNKQDTIIGKLIVEQGLATRTEVEDCLAMQAELAKEQNQRSLAELLVENGVVTRRQVERLRPQADEQTSTQQIPGYQILSRLGAGAMATVYKAKQLSLDRIVAVKVLPDRMSSNKEFVERFYKEGRAAAKLNHPNIVGAVDVGEANGRHYFVMEYVEGNTVYDKLDKGERYSEKEALSIITQVCRALVHAHKAGFIHRDVKPKNIMITPDGVAKLADMGLARETSDVEAAQAEAGKAYGTPYYIAPEQIRGELDVDQRADLYSLGATFYHMVTGRVPFDASTPSAVMHKHLKEDLIPPDHVVPELSAGVGEIIEVAMAKKRKMRYQSAEEMLADLEKVAAGEPPLFARKAYNLAKLEELEKGGTVSASEIQTQTNAIPISAQNTIDIDPRSMKQRLLDPIVLGLVGALLACMLLIFGLLLR